MINVENITLKMATIESW